MKRRDLLAVACASVTGLAGCGGFASRSRPNGADAPGGTTPSRPPLSEYGCPPYDSGEGPVVCSHTVDTEAAAVYLLSKTTTGAETPKLTLYNESSTELEFNPYQWSIRERRPSGWATVEKRSSGNGRLVLPAGGTHSWTFAEVAGYINEQLTLDAGTYAASIGVPDPGGPSQIRCIALVRLG